MALASPSLNVDAVGRARWIRRVQRVEATFSPLPFDAEAARQYGIIAAEVITMCRKPRGGVADLVIASIAAANGLPLFTTGPADFRRLESVVTVVPVCCPGIRSLTIGSPGTGPHNPAGVRHVIQLDVRVRCGQGGGD